jgi:hypothetical protein
VFPTITPNLVDPVTKLTLDVIVCTTNVCAVIVPVVVKAPDELTVNNVVEPLTKVIFLFASY